MNSKPKKSHLSDSFKAAMQVLLNAKKKQLADRAKKQKPK